MYDETLMTLNNCIECDKKIGPNEKMALIYKSKYGDLCVHAKECFAKYKKLLYSPEGIKDGIIIGICGWCAKPVRMRQEYYVGRTGVEGHKVNGQEKLHDFNTTFPSEENGHMVDISHKKCSDAANS